MTADPAMAAEIARVLARALTRYADEITAQSQPPRAVAPPAPTKAPNAAPAPVSGDPACPKCGGVMWNNHERKAAGQMKPNAPDFRCKDRACDGVIWPPRDAKPAARTTTVPMSPSGTDEWIPQDEEPLF